VTLREDEKSDSANNHLCFLPDLKQELEEVGVELLIQTSNLEQVIIEAASHTPDENPFKYLLGCWKRVMRLWNRARSGDPKNPRYQVIKEAKRLCLSYCMFAVTMPDMFDAAPMEKSPLFDHLLCNSESENGLCHDFLSESVARFSEDESIKFAFVAAIEQLSAELRKLTMNDNYKPYIAALRSCARYPPLAAAITESPEFIISDVKAERIEHDTLLGPFFALSPLHPDVAVNYFMGASVQGPTYVSNNQEVIRSTLRTHQDELFEIANAIIKSAKQPRERMLDWFALTVNKNHKRRATWVNSKEVASDGFMVNVTTILDRLCEPFMDSTFSKINRIDVNYLRRNPRVEITDETKINADQKASDEFYAQKDNKENNFISEIFFLTVAAHHYGSEAANHRIGQLERESKHFEKEVAKFEAERPKFTQVGHPNLALCQDLMV
jgi:ubiquitin conjugation factor E4 B